MDGTTEDLVSLGELGAGADLGLTGRPVFAGDGTLLGEVADVLGDIRGEGPRYLAVMLEAAVARQLGGRRVYVPFPSARVDDSQRVHLDTVTGESAVTLPTTPTSTPAADDEATVLDRARAADSLAGAGIASVAETPAPAAPATRELQGDEERVVLSEEELMVGKREVAAGEVVVHKHMEEQVVRQSVPLMREHVEVERRPVPPGVGFEPRTEDGVLYVPIVEEELVITKRLVAREELVIRKTRVTENQVVEETLRRERAEITGPN
ncbi:MAG TPA: PRC and DUF2382 domain-containing protein [Longimicrobium sp.]|jgi:uncharacterized protein (TIGR02271 family)